MCPLANWYPSLQEIMSPVLCRMEENFLLVLWNSTSSKAPPVVSKQGSLKPRVENITEGSGALHLPCFLKNLRFQGCGF